MQQSMRPREHVPQNLLRLDLFHVDRLLLRFVSLCARQHAPAAEQNAV